jgi:pimeloyl-ACP methyl ester carboxylesterase
VTVAPAVLVRPAQQAQQAQQAQRAPLAHLRWEPAAPRRAAPALAVLLHGIGGGREGWASTGAALAAAGFTVLAVDLPGYGHSAPLVEPSIDGFAAAVRDLIDAAGQGAALVVGHSLGGMVAQALAATALDRVAALVLAGTSPAFGSSDGAWQQEFLRARLAPLDAGVGMPGLAAQLVPAMAGRDANPEKLAAAQALMAGVPEATYRAVLPALVRFDRRAALSRIAVPTLVLAGEDDRTAPPAVAEKMAARMGTASGTAAGAECRVLPRTGHLQMLENPAAFDAALIDFVQRRLPGATEPTEETVDVRRA